MRKALTLLLFFSVFMFSNAQVYMNGSTARATPGLIMYVNTDSLLLENNALFQQDGFLQIDKDLINNSGAVNNDGTIDINENLLNNDAITGVSANSEIILEGNWENNSLYTSNTSSVTLDGNNQNITGTVATDFYNLTCLGNVNDVKHLIGTDAQVLGVLDLGDVEFATDFNTLSVENPNVNAITRNDGFVSSLGAGRLNRNTNAIDEYLYPVGSSIGGVKYRPIVVTTQSVAADVFGVRFANTDATLEGFDVDELADSLCLVNPEFYHRIYGNSQVDIQMFYDLGEDGNWTDMAHWQDEPLWHDMGNENTGLSGGFQTLEIEDWNNFSTPAFALAVKNPYLEIGPTIEGFVYTDVAINPTYIGPTPNSIEWTPAEDLDCDDCLNTVANLFESTTFVLNINEGERCAVSDTVLVLIIPDEISMPSGFTPNGDGINDFFLPMNTNVEMMKLQVYNRWGEKIFESTDPGFGWDGTYKGVLQPLGVFAYYVEYRLDGQTEDKSTKGSITLLR